MQYLPKVLTLEEFETLTALTDCLFPQLSAELAAMFDWALHETKREIWRLADLPPDAQAIRSGLQLLNYDSLKYAGRAFARLTHYRKDVLLAKLQRDGDAHWPQFPAGKWFREVLSIATDLYMSSSDGTLRQRLQTRQHTFLPIPFPGTKANLFP